MHHYNTNFIIDAEKHKEFNKAYRIWIAPSEQVICTIIWTCVFCGNKTGFVRPGHIYGHQLSTSPNSRHFDVTSTSKTLNKKARHHFRILENFNRQCQKEHLLSLRENYNVKNRRVTCTSTSSRRCCLSEIGGEARCWCKLAEVAELIYSKDNTVRAAWVKVISSDKAVTLRRPVTCLIPLEVPLPSGNSRSTCWWNLTLELFCFNLYFI